MIARYKLFRSSFDSWETMCQQAADFLTENGPSPLDASAWSATIVGCLSLSKSILLVCCDV
ncbi:hypothetical protein ETAA8_11610 [Anatilimnocola aggregata]|uniref:Uncharacterized protein n=1 Tax=Anatilimnocola aggregata TaxID=2528021 RepID=A0A517Y784_9BACT|nr:hypothetical protein ETAA8_11610 [Anatilimnocola aggregata]